MDVNDGRGIEKNGDVESQVSSLRLTRSQGKLS